MKTTSNTLIGGLLCVLAYIFLSGMSAISKHLQDIGFSVFQIIFFSFFITFILSLPWAFKRGLKTAFKTKYLSRIVYRSVLGFAAFSVLFLSVKQIPLVDSLTLFNTAPLWVPFLAFIFLKERFSYKTFLCIVLGFIGIILVIHPRFTAMNYLGDSEALLAGFGVSFVIVIIRLLKDEDHQRVVFYYGIISSVIGFFFILNSGKRPEGIEW
jgi:drug/metabolite transporter (DMT)-like permease